MPQRPFTRDQVFLLPPRLDEWIAPDHPARFVATWLEQLPPTIWREMGIDLQPAERGEARYAPQALLAIWVYGFMVGIRSTRSLEQACRDQLPFRWLSGNQTPDHNTLHRFYKNHRQSFVHLFHASIDHAARQGMIDWSIQAVDGTKLWANASGDKMLTEAALTQLAEQVDIAIAQLDATTVETAAAKDDTTPKGPQLPHRRRDLEALRARIERAQVRIAEGRHKAHRTDPDAHQMTAKGVNRPSYNAQAVVRSLRSGGHLIVTLDVRTRADDHDILPELAMQAAMQCGQAAAVTVADTGYFSAAVLGTCQQQGLSVAMPIPRHPGDTNPYGPNAFVDDPQTGTLICPEGVPLRRWNCASGLEVRYSAPDTVCRHCPAKPRCCPNSRRGRMIVRSVHHRVRQQHAHRMATPLGQAVLSRRSGLIEGVFGTLKHRHGARQCLLRGVEQVQAEWTLLATTFNLRTLSQYLPFQATTNPTPQILVPARGLSL